LPGRVAALKSATRLDLTPQACQALMAESADELAALRSALGS
jgi:hypothetical protein